MHERFTSLINFSKNSLPYFHITSKSYFHFTSRSTINPYYNTIILRIKMSITSESLKAIITKTDFRKKSRRQFAKEMKVNEKTVKKYQDEINKERGREGLKLFDFPRRTLKVEVTRDVRGRFTFRAHTNFRSKSVPHSQFVKTSPNLTRSKSVKNISLNENLKTSPNLNRSKSVKYVSFKDDLNEYYEMDNKYKSIVGKGILG